MNYLEFLDLQKPHLLEKALLKIDEALDECKDFEDQKFFLSELNTFVYGHYLSKYEWNLVDIFNANKDLIKSATTYGEIIDTAHYIMRSYTESIDQDMIIEDRLIRQAIDIVSQEFTNKISLGEVAKKLNVSPNYLSRMFSLKTGYRFIEYVNILRVQHAKKLIETTDNSLDYIGDICGFANQPHFSLTFKKVAGMTPSEYRSKYGKK